MGQSSQSSYFGRAFTVYLLFYDTPTNSRPKSCTLAIHLLFILQNFQIFLHCISNPQSRNHMEAHMLFALLHAHSMCTRAILKRRNIIDDFILKKIAYTISSRLEIVKVPSHGSQNSDYSIRNIQNS